MKSLAILCLACSLTPPQAEARDSVSIGIGISSGRSYGPSYYGPTYPRYYGPAYRTPYCPPSYPAYSTPVYISPPSPIYYAPAPPIYPGQPAHISSYEPSFQPTPVNQTVLRVQSALRLRKYYPGSLDGLSGPATQAAIRAYQLDRDLAVTGRIDSILLADLGL